jgi:hypothetical protein
MADCALLGKNFLRQEILKKSPDFPKNCPQLWISKVLLARAIVVHKIHSAMNRRARATEKKFLIAAIFA